MAEKGKYVYDWPRPMVTVDAVVFAKTDDKTEVLLINRGKEPFKGKWALPGGFIDMDEELEDAVVRELEEETGLTEVRLEQMRTFGTVGRDPRGRQISVAFMGLATKGQDKIKAGDDAAQAQWFDIENLPKEMAFDHDEVVRFAIEKLLKMKMSQKKHNLLNTIKPYRLVSKCFAKYISWICENVKENDLEDYDLISILNSKDFKKLQLLEDLLERSRYILGVKESDFTRMFGFRDDLLVADPEKVHDILAEPLLVVDLDSHGFSSIQKIPRSVKSQGKLIPVGDFIATLKDQKFAIELKTVRTESWAEEGKPLGDATIPSWWQTMFRNNAITKIEDKDRRAIAQLEDTTIHYGCDYKMLVLYTRRLGPSTLMSKTSYLEELEFLKNRYPEIDYFCSKDYFGEIVFYPELS
ncbi:MAG TPA: NUDIX hydrolase [Sedimentisphaerales bacterium]|nr:NUDIX hydrolase [Sedimentisphaerales bacterium]